MTETTRLDRVLALTQRTNRSAVHVRHPREDSLTLCGRTVDKYPPVDSREGLATSPVGCPDCRVLERIREDRIARGLPELCWAYPRFMGHRLPRCSQPLDGHAKRRGGGELHDGDVDSWHDTYLECARCEKQSTAGAAEDAGWTSTSGGPVDLDDAICPPCRAKETTAHA